jgi:hypothetical protein
VRGSIEHGNIKVGVITYDDGAVYIALTDARTNTKLLGVTMVPDPEPIAEEETPEQWQPRMAG